MMHYNRIVQTPVSLRLDPAVREALERDAKAHGIGLGTYLRQMAQQRARELRGREIFKQSRAVGFCVRRDAQGGALYDEIGGSEPVV